MHYWVYEYPVTTAAEEASASEGAAVQDYQYLCEVLSTAQINTPIILGSNQSMIQADESLFRHKPKYHRERAASREQWVFGLVVSSYLQAECSMGQVLGPVSSSSPGLHRSRFGAVAPNKVEGPCTMLCFLGIELDLVRLMTHLPNDKLAQLAHFVNAWGDRKMCTKWQLLSLIGVLQHASSVVQFGHCFLRHMIDRSVHNRLNREFIRPHVHHYFLLDHCTCMLCSCLN